MVLLGPHAVTPRHTPREAIETSQFNFVVLQEQSTLPVKNAGKSAPTSDAFVQDMKRNIARLGAW